MPKLVSYILPVQDGGPHLKAAVASVLAQDHQTLELIAIDDGSSDGSAEVLQRFAERDPRLRVVAREHRGLAATLNEGLALARGELVAQVGAGDIAYPGRTSMQAALFEQQPDLAIAGARVDRLYAGNRVIGDAGEDVGRADIKVESLFNCPFVPSSVMLNNALLAQKGLRYDPDYPGNEGFELFGRILRGYPGFMMGQPGLASRQFPPNRIARFSGAAAHRMKLFEQNMRGAGLSDDLSVFHAITASGAPPDDVQLMTLRNALHAVYSYRYLFETAVPAYERGFRGMVNSFLGGLMGPGALARGIEAVDKAGFGRYVMNRHRLDLRLGRIMTPEAAQTALAYAEKISVRVKSTRLARAASLPPSVQAEL